MQADAAKYTLAAGKFSPLTINFGNGGKDTGWLNKIVNLWGERAIFNRIVDADGNVKFFTRSEKMVDALKYINDMYAQGLLDPDLHLQQRDPLRGLFPGASTPSLGRPSGPSGPPTAPCSWRIPTSTTPPGDPYAVEGVKPMLNGYDTTGVCSTRSPRTARTPRLL